MRSLNNRFGQIVSIALVLVMGLSLTACGSDSEGDNSASFPGGNTTSSSRSESASVTASSQAAASQAGGTDAESGMELTDYTNALIDAIGTTSGRFASALNSSDASATRLMDLNNATMAIAMAAPYDLVGGSLSADANRNAYREKNGDVITFGEDYEREQEGGYGADQLVGDREITSGTVDLAAGTIFYEHTTERDGAVIRRNITEGVLLPDSGAMLQWLDVGVTASGMDPEGKAIFIAASAETLTVLRGTFDYDTAFSYTTILGKGAMTAEEMATGYDLIWNITSDLQTATSERY